MLLNFLYLIFLVVIVGGAIIFFIAGDRFMTFANFIRSAWPIMFLLVALAFKLRLTKAEERRYAATGLSLRTITISYGDKMKGEIVTFLAPVAVLLVAAFSEEGVWPLDIVQAFFVLIIVYAWNKYLWLRAR